MIYSIDFFVNILANSFFHPSFVLIFLPYIYMQVRDTTHPAFLVSVAYAGTVLFFWGLGDVTRIVRDGWGGKRTNWDSEVVVITGGSRGLGLLLAETLAFRNASVAVLDLVPPDVENDNISYFECDVSDYDKVQRVAREVIEEIGHPTILINNAGVVAGKSILDLSPDEIRRTFEVNSMSSFWTTKAFLPHMLEKDHGHIVTVASVLAYTSLPQLADYSASKAAVSSFHEALYHELKTRYKSKNIRLTLVCPGLIGTDLFRGVKMRLPFLTPPLAPFDVVKKIVIALDRNQSTHIILPWVMNLAPLLRFLPGFLVDLAHAVTGANYEMQNFVGRSNRTVRTESETESETETELTDESRKEK